MSRATPNGRAGGASSPADAATDSVKSSSTTYPTPPRGGHGKPVSDIDYKLVERLARSGANTVEIADILGVSDTTIVRRCGDILKVARANLRISIRRKQVTMALGGHPTMLIWLGKVMLDQREVTAVEHSGAEGVPLVVSVTHTIVDPGAG